LSATFFMLLVDFSIVSIALPSMERELQFDPLVAGLAFLPSTLVTALIAAPLTLPTKAPPRPRRVSRFSSASV
jgi:hypothetical protein